MSNFAKSVRFDDSSMWVDIGWSYDRVPLAWFPRLMHASPAQLDTCAISQNGLHWDETDEDISIAGLLAGRGDMTHATKVRRRSIR